MDADSSPPGSIPLELGPHHRVLTFVVVEPEALTQKQLVEMLSQHGHRVVPVTNAEEATELVRRFKFDSAVCSTRLAGLNWVDFYERVRDHVESFVLLTDGYDADLAKAFEGVGDAYVLSKPLEAAHLSRVLGTIDKRDSRLEGAWT
jgi:two-component SAPR family response regulator